MNHKTFISALASATGLQPQEATRRVEQIAALLRNQCADEGAVAFPGFGTFTGVKHDEEISIDLASGKRMLLPPAMEVTFTPGSGLKHTINKPNDAK